MKFHVNRDGTGFGPYEESEARSLYAQGNIVATDLVWHEGMAQWKTAREVLGEPPMAASTMPPPVPQAHPPSPMPGWVAPLPRDAAAMQGQPLPPKLHWGLVVLFSLLSFGIFAIVWMFLQSSWVRKIDPQSNATKYLIGYLVLAVIGGAMGESEAVGTKGMGVFLQLLSFVFFYCGYYSMRRSMLHYYNSVEPIALRLSNAMVFFFSMPYLQYHMTRIAKWKMGGALRPQ